MSAQNDTENDTETRFLTIYFDTLYGQSSPQLNTLIALIQDDLSIVFEESGISPIIETDPDFSAVSVIFDLVDNTIFINFESIPPLPNLLPAPTLIAHPASTFPLEANVDNPLWRIVVGEFTVALGEYIYGDCDAMSTHLQTAEEIVVQIEELSYAQETIAYLNFYRANCAISQEDYESAQAFYESILAYYSDNNYDFRYGLETRINLAWIHYKMGDGALAYNMLNRVIGLAGSNWASVAALQMRASFHIAEEDFESAIEDFDEALEFSVDNPYIIGQIIAVLIQMDDLRAADKELSRLSKLEDGYPVILFYQGLLAYAEGDMISAKDLLSEFVSLSLNDYLTLEAEIILTEILSES